MKVLLLLATAGLLIFLGCEVKETHSNLGSIAVQLLDERDSVVVGARVWLDSVQTDVTTALNPVVLHGVGVGSHDVMTTKPGYEAASSVVTVVEDDTVNVELTALDVPLARVVFENAPEGTLFLVDNVPYDTLPPNEFDFGIGTWLFSAYLPSNATNSPARLTVTLEPRDTLTVPVQFTPTEEGNDVGQLAPVFTLQADGDGTVRHSLQHYRGKIVLVSFFFYNCAPCLDEFPHIQEAYADPAYAGWFTVLAIDRIDPWFQFNLYRSDHEYLGLQFPLLWDQQTHQTDPYEIVSCPSNFLVDPSGIIRYRWGSVSEAELRSAIESLISEFDAPVSN